jgi:uncharacterized protein (TIGR02246 family)
MDEWTKMGAATPEQIDELMQAAYKLKDAEALADLYEDDAIFANTEAGWTAVGRTELVAKFNEMFSTFSVGGWDVDRLKFAQAGDYAFSHDTTVTHLVLADGTPLDVSGRGTIVAHQGADGNWRLLIDHASAL